MAGLLHLTELVMDVVWLLILALFAALVAAMGAGCARLPGAAP